MKKILVTGGAGYVGSVVTETLCKNGFPVVVVDDLRDSEKKIFPRKAPDRAAYSPGEY